jgi:hypothetical protein
MAAGYTYKGAALHLHFVIALLKRNQIKTSRCVFSLIADSLLVYMSSSSTTTDLDPGLAAHISLNNCFDIHHWLFKVTGPDSLR